MSLRNIANIIYYWRNRHDPECANALSKIIWRYLLFFAVGFVIVSGTYSLWLYLGGISGVETSAVAGQSETLSREALNNTLELYEQREQRFEYVKNNPPNIQDPSR